MENIVKPMPGPTRSRSFEGFTDCNNTMPQGWKFKNVQFGSRAFKLFLTPSGDKIKGKKLSLKYMLERGYPESDITSVRNSFKEDGWMTSELLPVHWFFKKGIKLYFLNQNGDYFNSESEAIKHLMSQNLNEDVQMLSRFVQNQNQNKKNENLSKNVIGEGFIECDQTMPRGWKCKSVQLSQNRRGTLKIFLTPSGDRIKGKKSTLKYMLERGYPESDITTLRNSFKADGWKTSERLPVNWFFKQDQRLTFINQFGNYFHSKVKALEFLKSKDFNEDFQMLSKFTSP